MTAAAACLTLSEDRIPERQAPLTNPLLKARAQPDRTAALVPRLMDLDSVGATDATTAAPPRREKAGGFIIAVDAGAADETTALVQIDKPMVRLLMILIVALR